MDKILRVTLLCIFSFILFSLNSCSRKNRQYKDSATDFILVTDKMDSSIGTPTVSSDDIKNNIIDQLLQNSLRAPLDSLSAIECCSALESSLSISNKLINEGLESTEMGGKMIGSTIIIFSNGIRVLDSSKNVLQPQEWENYLKIKREYRSNEPMFIKISESYLENYQ